MTDRRTFIAGAAAALLAPPAFARTPWRRLFNGSDLDGWSPIGDANWRVENGLLIADRGGISFLVSRESYSDLEIRARFWVSGTPIPASSCAVRTAPGSPRTMPMRPISSTQGPIRPTAPAPSSTSLRCRRCPGPAAAGTSWRSAPRGDRFSVTLNGRTTVEGARDGRYREGQIALQYGAGTVRFRRVDIRPL